ncbi:MAG: hypothetical protein RLZZ15_3088 [Verrucomicrobiota bacterium]
MSPAAQQGTIRSPVRTPNRQPPRFSPMSAPANQAVFLSYASQDAEAARRICETLRSAGMEVWFDADGGLEQGDEWDAKIRRQIKECVLFLPLISTNTQARHEGYFRIEWELAAERAMGFASGVPFILPIAIDATREPDALVPDRFRKVQWTRLQGGELPPEVLARFLKLWSHRTGALKAAELEPGRPRPAERGEGAAAPTNQPSRRLPVTGWLAATALLIVCIAGASLWLRRPALEKSPPPDLRRDASATTPPAATPAIAENSISVLPFENRSTEPDSAYFADGIQDEIITGLSLISNLRVVGSGNSVEIFRASKKPLPQIARELGVAWLVRGSVGRMEAAVTVNVRLVRAEADQIVWAKTFRSDRKEAAGIQAEVVTALTTALQATVSPAEKALLARTPTMNTEAYDLYLQQREIYIRKGSGAPSVRNQRKALLEKAVVLDPGFTRAWAELVWLRRTSSGRPSPQALAASKAALETLEKLAPNAPETALARVGYVAETVDAQQALAMYQNLARTMPRSVGVLPAIGWFQKQLGQWGEAIASMRRAIDLDPVDPQVRRNLVECLIECRRLREALAEQRGLVGLLPDVNQEVFRVGRLAYDVDGSTREMEQFFARLPPSDRETPEIVDLRRQWAQIRGAREEALALAKIPVDSSYYQTIFAGMAFAANGDQAAARARLEKRIAIYEKRGSKNDEWSLSEFAIVRALSGDQVGALVSAGELERLLPNLIPEYQPIFRARLASIYAWAGEKDLALRDLTRLLREPGAHLIRFDGGDELRARINVHELRSCLEFSPLQGDPRFEALLNDPKNNEPLF